MAVILTLPARVGLVTDCRDNNQCLNEHATGFYFKTMTLGEINTKITQLTGTDTTSYPNSTRLIDINNHLQKVVGMIFDSQDETDYDDQRNTDYPIVTTSLTTNRDYTIPVSEKVLRIKNVSISYDGTNVYRASPLEINSTEMPVAPASATTANANIDQYFDIISPRYDIKYNSIFIYPKPTQAQVDAGGFMVIEWERQPTPFTLSELTTGTEVPGFDDTFHMMLALGPALDYCIPLQLPQKNDIAQMYADYETRLRKQYSSKQKDRVYQFKSSIWLDTYK